MSDRPDLRNFVREVGVLNDDIYAALRDIDHELTTQTEPDKKYVQEAASRVEWGCAHIYRRLCFAFEVIGAHHTRERLMNEFEQRIGAEGRMIASPGDYEDDEEYGFLFFKPHSRLNWYRQMLADAFPLEKEPEQPKEVAILERILRNTPAILADQELVPGKESDVYDAIGSVLRVVFPDCTAAPTIHKVLKSYKPEFGLINLRIGIEYKFIADLDEAKTAVDGIFTDMAGYETHQFKTFYAVLYITDPKITKDQIDAHVAGRALRANWKILAVHGGGERKRRAGAAAKDGAGRDNG